MDEVAVPPCRVCGKSESVVCYPDDHSQTVCPDCCDKVTEHPNDGESGHVWEYDRGEREDICKHCGIQKRCTEHAWEE